MTHTSRKSFHTWNGKKMLSPEPKASLQNKKWARLLIRLLLSTSISLYFVITINSPVALEQQQLVSLVKVISSTTQLTKLGKKMEQAQNGTNELKKSICVTRYDTKKNGPRPPQWRVEGQVADTSQWSRNDTNTYKQQRRLQTHINKKKQQQWHFHSTHLTNTTAYIGKNGNYSNNYGIHWTISFSTKTLNSYIKKSREFLLHIYSILHC